jgi:hypothetical protein
VWRYAAGAALLVLAMSGLPAAAVATGGGPPGPVTGPVPVPRPAPAVTIPAAPPRVVPPPPAVRASVARSAAVRRTGRPAPPPGSRPARPASFARRASFADRLAAALARLPGYRPGLVRWEVTTAWWHWGTADLYRGVVYLSPRIPAGYLYDVVAHEWAHMVSVRAYGGDVAAAKAAMNRFFGGTGMTGAERAADCMAVLLGARWTHYTACPSAPWRQGARTLLAGRRL